jgi:AcrR family transcriptional regulator
VDDVGGPVEVMPRPMRADARRNYDRLVAAAAAAFAEHGLDAPLDDIARRAGVGAGTLYRHFANREALMEAVYGAQVEGVCARAATLGATQPPAEALTLWLRDLVAHISAKRGLAAAIMAGGGGETSPAFAACKSALRGAAGSLLERAQAAGAVRPDLSLDDLLRLMHGVAVSSEYSPDGPDHLIALVVDGLRRYPTDQAPPAG